MRNGVQYARTTTKSCPMYDDACAARVIQQIADRYPRGLGATAQAEVERREQQIAQYEGIIPILNDPQAIENLTVEILELRAQAAAYRRAVEAETVSPEQRAAALVEEKCGRYTRGQHAGKLRGWAEIEVVVEGGWRKYGPGERNGRVVRPGTILKIEIRPFAGAPYLTVTNERS